jgi:DNA-binding MarR family transcriptional regulator
MPETNNLGRNFQSGEVKDVLESIRQIVRALRVASRASEKELGLSAAQLLVLQRLAHVESMSLNELAEQTQTHQSSTSVVVSKLVSRGLLARTRSKGDARRLELSLTSKAKLLVRKTPHAAQDRLIESLARMSKAERKQLAALLKKIVANGKLGEP